MDYIAHFYFNLYSKLDAIFKIKKINLFLFWMVFFPVWIIDKVKCLHLSKNHIIRNMDVTIKCEKCNKFLGKIHKEDLPVRISIKRRLEP